MGGIDPLLLKLGLTELVSSLSTTTEPETYRENDDFTEWSDGAEGKRR